MTTEKEQNWHNLSINKVCEQFKTSVKGLTSQEVKDKRKKFGFNKLPAKKPLSRLTLLLNQIKSPLVYVLLVAVIISLFLEHFTDAGVIMFVVIVNTIFGYWQENKANNAAQKLKEIVKHQAKVLRDGNLVLIDSEQLVPGDVIILKAGDKIPADARLFRTNDLQTIEAALTGESAPIKKRVEELPKGTALVERQNMVYMGSLIARGEGKAVVCAIGTKTEIGKISLLIAETKDDKTPLQYQLSKFSHQLTIIILFLSFLIFTEGYFSSRNLVDVFLTVVALAVSAIPEGLLIAVTIILTLGMQFILKHKALVRKLIAAETLGSTSVICTDKTGTLTQGVMRVSKVITADQEYEITSGQELSESEKARDLINKVSVLCSSAVVTNPGSELEHIKIIGDPTETALLLASIQAGFVQEELVKQYKRIAEIPFDSSKKYMASLYDHFTANHQHIFIKGAPEKVFVFCKRILRQGKKQKLTREDLTKLKYQYENLTKKGLRLLAFAYKTGKFTKIEDELNDLVFLGFVAVKDPLRPDAKATIKLCQQAGIRTVVITGDHKLTAKAIFEELGFKVKGHIVEGKDLDSWSDKELSEKVKNIDIYARVEPHHKLRIVNAWQAAGEVVAMTGDEINDAPAIKAADIGIAFGSGSDITKETADIILLDNNFKVIVAAVEHGRVIFENIRKVILYLLSDSFSEMILIAGSIILGMPLPLLATQILWINLIDDGLPNIAMTFEPGEKGVMKDKPRPKGEPILNREMKILIFVIGAVTDLLVFLTFVILLKFNFNIDHARTIVFVALGLDSLIYAFGVRSLRHSIFTKNPFSNKYLVGAVLISLAAFLSVIYIPWLQLFFNTVPLGLEEWILILGLAILKITFIEIVKYHFILKQKRKIVAKVVAN